MFRCSTDKKIGTLESGRLMEGSRLIGGRLIEYRLYIRLRQLGSHFILHFNFLVLVESHSPGFLCN